MAIFNVSEVWSNGQNRSFRGFDPFDDKVEIRANGNTPCVIDGNGNCTITGNRRRIYCHYNNYNAILTVTLIPQFKERNDNCSLKMRSRHNEPGKICKSGGPLDGNRFGGYGFAIDKNGWDAKREPTHNCHDQHRSGSIPKKLENGQEVRLRQTVKDENMTVRQIGEVDYMDGKGFHKVMDTFDNSPKPWMVDRNLYETKSYFWIRNNGSGSITIKDVSLEILS
jgi:hypothetical protein